MQYASEVVQLRAQMIAEYEAGKRVLTVLEEGKLQQQFITKRVENMQRCQEQLIALIGPEKANAMIAEVGL